VRLRPQAAGTIFFTSRATTVLGTAVLDTASVVVGNPLSATR
jgi:hypothetical protein